MARLGKRERAELRLLKANESRLRAERTARIAAVGETVIKTSLANLWPSAKKMPGYAWGYRGGDAGRIHREPWQGGKRPAELTVRKLSDAERIDNARRSRKCVVTSSKV